MPAFVPPRLHRTVGYVRQWGREAWAGREWELEFDRGDRRLPASIFAPAGEGLPDHAWLVLHGITRPGRAHPSLLRFARAVASSGALVVVPEVPEWIELSLAPEQTLPTALASLTLLEDELGIPAARTGMMGFSFGAPQGLVAASDPQIVDRIAGVAGFGGYCDLERAVRFLFTGVHEWQGSSAVRRPDPYGRWIVAANFLLEVPGYSGAEAVRDALLELAQEVGEQQIPAWDPIFDPIKDRVKARLSPDETHLFERFAPHSSVSLAVGVRDGAGGLGGAGRPPGAEASDEAERWAERLTEAGRRTTPLIDPVQGLGRTPRHVELLHGLGDDLIPYTETLRWGERLTAARRDHGQPPPRTTITPLFAHSREEPKLNPVRMARETVRFVRALSRILAIP